MINYFLGVFSWQKNVIEAPNNSMIVPIICDLFIFSLSKIMPNINTKRGSNTDNIEAFSTLIYSNAFNKNKIGIAVQNNAMQEILIHISN